MRKVAASVRNFARALSDGHPVVVMAVSLLLYELIAELLNRYWVAALVRIMGFFRISSIYPYLAACLNLAILLIFVIGMMSLNGQIRVLFKRREPLFKGLLYGGWIVLFSGWSIIASIMGAEGLRSGPDIAFSMLYYILIAVIEELVFRGIIGDILFRVVKQRRGGADSLKTAAIISGIVFSMAHFRNILISGLPGAAVLIVGALIMGTLLSVIYLRTGSIYSVIVLHAINDIAAAFPVTVLKGGASVAATVAGYGAAELLLLVPCAVSTVLLLRMKR